MRSFSTTLMRTGSLIPLLLAACADFQDPADPNAAWCSRAPPWSRDGRELYFVSFRPATGGAGAAFNEIFVMNADGSSPTRLTSSPGEDGGPRMR